MFVKRMNKRGESTHSCGEPVEEKTWSDRIPFTFNLCVLPVKSKIQPTTLLLRSNCSKSRLIKMWVWIVLKADEKSTNNNRCLKTESMNCMGSRAYSVFFRFFYLTSFSKVFIRISVRAIGLKSLIVLGPLTLGTGTTTASFQTLGTCCSFKDLSKMYWNTGLSFFAQDFSNRLQILSGRDSSSLLQQESHVPRPFGQCESADCHWVYHSVPGFHPWNQKYHNDYKSNHVSNMVSELKPSKVTWLLSFASWRPAMVFIFDQVEPRLFAAILFSSSHL